MLGLKRTEFQFSGISAVVAEAITEVAAATLPVLDEIVPGFKSSVPSVTSASWTGAKAVIVGELEPDICSEPDYKGKKSKLIKMRCDSGQDKMQCSIGDEKIYSSKIR